MSDKYYNPMREHNGIAVSSIEEFNGVVIHTEEHGVLIKLGMEGWYKPAEHPYILGRFYAQIKDEFMISWCESYLEKMKEYRK